MDYRYGADGQRALKYSSRGETLYFDSMWQATTDNPSFRRSKHVYVGQTRVATRCNIQDQPDAGYEETNTFYYHSDHLGSAQLVSRSDGNQYEHREYTPYGESWIEQRSEPESKVPFRFTGKEQDPETGLYYYGARYLNPKTSMWISSDPALESYLPVAPVSGAARKHNANLPGMGGVFNPINLVAYHYAGNNPLKLVDPDGNADFYCWMIWIQNSTNRDYGADQIRAAINSVYNGDYLSAGISGTSAIIECVTDVLDNDISSVTGISPLSALNNLARLSAYTGRSADEIIKQVQSADFSTPKDCAVFWTGYRLGNQATAKKWAAENGKFTIDMTPGGKWLNSLDLYGKNSPVTIEQADAIWRVASIKFAWGASGKVSAFTRGTSYNKDTMFYGIELPILRSNPNVDPTITYRGY